MLLQIRFVMHMQISGYMLTKEFSHHIWVLTGYKILMTIMSVDGAVGDQRAQMPLDSPFQGTSGVSGDRAGSEWAK